MLLEKNELDHLQTSAPNHSSFSISWHVYCLCYTPSLIGVFEPISQQWEGERKRGTSLILQLGPSQKQTKLLTLVYFRKEFAGRKTANSQTIPRFPEMSGKPSAPGTTVLTTARVTDSSNLMVKPPPGAPGHPASPAVPPPTGMGCRDLCPPLGKAHSPYHSSPRQHCQLAELGLCPHPSARDLGEHVASLLRQPWWMVEPKDKWV